MFENKENESFPESFPGREARILEFWLKSKIFNQSVERRKFCPLFSTYDGPPFATGLPHYGHILAGTIKDVILRYKTMQGYYVPRRFGWDCHGLPVENEIEKAKELSGASSIAAYGIDTFNEECRQIVLRYTKEWEDTVNRMGRFVDIAANYKTMDLPFMESVWWVFGQLYGKGLVYEGFKVMPFSARLGTPLSNFEANLNYKDVDDPSLTVSFPLDGDPNTAFLAWTTTPWTLPSNLALMVGPDIDYVKVHETASGSCYILAEARLSHYFKEPSSYEIVEHYKGSSLAGLRYEPLFPYFAGRGKDNAFRVIVEDSVATEEGTGIVHCAPAFGEVDFFAASKAGIEIVCPVDHNGKFTQEVPEYAGLFVKDADKEIIKRLKTEQRIFHHGQIRHRYPFCWRSDTPLIYKAVRTWFVAVEKIKDKMLEVNAGIHWVPENIRDGRFGKWLENARDWAISRNRYWGTPIPIWRSEDGTLVVISSVKELEERTGQKVDDLHSHKIDHLTFVEDGKVFHRVSEVFDCWFESGSVPYAQNHFPFENKEETLAAFPADFIAEGLDQTRGWFYTLTVLSTALFGKSAFKNVIVNGIILAEDGAKMSKRLKNYPEPEKVMNQYGADAVRLYLINSPAVYAEDLRFSERGVELVLRQVLIPLWNAYVFLATYARIDGWSPSRLAPILDIDRWILSLTQKLIHDVKEGMDVYDLSRAVTPLVQFIDQLTNWYIRRSRPRFWSEEDTPDRAQAFETLYAVLMTVVKIAAPFIPFLSDAIYRLLRSPSDLESVHLADYPASNEALRAIALEMEMASVQTVVSSAHGLRKEHKIKVRQPLAKAHVITADLTVLAALDRQKQLIADELNVKEVLFSSEEKNFVTLVAKPNFRVLGKKVGKLMNAVHKATETLSAFQLESLFQGKEIILEVEGEKISLTSEDVAVQRQVIEGLVAATENGITIVLDTALTESLLTEGLAREIVNKINTMRRDLGFSVTDRIRVQMDTTERVKQCFEEYKEYIAREVLATGVLFDTAELGTEWDLNGERAVIAISLA
ncbi:MAG: isoleucine--tRNA ligase [Chlamydiota bacterium]